jgi:hypothetical protein
VRAGWEDVQQLIEKHTGPVTSAHDAHEGFNSEIAIVINDTTFVKGLRADHPRVWTQERERLINPHVRHISAHLQWDEQADGWDLNGFEYLGGRSATYTPGSEDLGLITAMMTQLPRAPGDLELKRAEQRWSAYSAQAALFAGDGLAHTDWSPSNVLMVDGRAVVVDWAWPTRGASWLDPACWVVWLIASGHHPEQAEEWALRVPAFQQAPQAAVTAFAEAQAAMWEDIGEHAPHAGLAAAAARWAKHRNI